MQEAKVASVMSAYNRINGESATASQRFLNDILRRQWGFTGYVVSDCGAVDDIFMRHKIVPTAEEGSASPSRGAATSSAAAPTAPSRRRWRKGSCGRRTDVAVGACSPRA